MSTRAVGVRPDPPGVEVEELVKIDRVARLLGCSVDTVIRRCEREGLPHRRFGNRRHFLLSEVRAWLDGLRVVKHARPEAPARGPAQGSPGRAPASDFEAEVRATRRARPGG